MCKCIHPAVIRCRDGLVLMRADILMHADSTGERAGGVGTSFHCIQPCCRVVCTAGCGGAWVHAAPRLATDILPARCLPAHLPALAHARSEQSSTAIRDACHLAPLHNPPNLHCIEAAQALFPASPHVSAHLPPLTLEGQGAHIAHCSHTVAICALQWSTYQAVLCCAAPCRAEPRRAVLRRAGGRV